MRILQGTIALAVTLAVGALVAAVPRPLADMQIPLPQGKLINLKSYRGKVLVVALITTECATCIKSIDILNRMQQEFGSKGVQMVAVAGDQNAQYVIEPFVQRYRPLFPVGYLNIEQMARLGDISPKENHNAPILIFVDRKGMVRQQVFGENPLFKTEEASLRQLIQDMLKL